MQDEAQVIIHSNTDKTEFTFVIKSRKPLSNSEVILELEFLINQLSRAQDQMDRPGVQTH